MSGQLGLDLVGSSSSQIEFGLKIYWTNMSYYFYDHNLDYHWSN